MLSIFLENRQLITEKGWIVSDPESPRWWGGLESYEEIIISSILVQMTRWETVAEVIENMRQRGYTNIRSLASLSEDEILSIIRKVNFSRTKAKRLRALAIEASKYPTLKEFVKYGLRDLEGIGDETYYSLLLFVGNETQFPPSEYGSRVMSRVTSMRIPKSRVRETIESNLERDLFKYKLFHSGLVTVGRTSCFKEPKCGKCILKMICKLNNNNEALRI
ncbi:hypothetical protein [Sulfuracidifex tepidarius]|nr:hypothetical protein [Sulfuracidifex tepidarius]